MGPPHGRSSSPTPAVVPLSPAEAGSLGASARARAPRSRTRATVVNFATGLRLVLTPAVLALVLAGIDTWAALLFVVAAVTDYLDGYLARRWRVVSPAGSFLDTTADKILVTGALLGLLTVGRASAWAVLLIVARELALMGLRGSAALGGVLVTASQLGRLKTAVQFLAILLAILDVDLPLGPLPLYQWAIWVAVALTLGSAAQYLRRWPLEAGAAGERR